MAISRINQWSATGNSASASVAIAPLNGDMLVAVVCATAAPPVPSGWTALGAGVSGSSNVLQVMSRLANGLETDLTVAVTSGRWGVGVISYRGANAPAALQSTTGGNGVATVTGPDPPAVAAGVFTVTAASQNPSGGAASSVSAGWTKVIDAFASGLGVIMAESTSTDPAACTFTFGATGFTKPAVAFSMTVAPLLGQAQAGFYMEA